jgi:DNA-binding SARP family transcriptional activator/Flp pilus assembly protein TadD
VGPGGARERSPLSVCCAGVAVDGLEFRILGPVEAWRNGRPVDLSAPKERGLLAALLVSANRVVAADQLIDHLWGDDPPATSLNTLQTLVLRLRRALQPGAGAVPGVLVTRAPGYLLVVAPGRLDLHRFEQLLALARRARAARDLTRAVGCLREGLALWRGPALAGAEAPGLRLTEVPRLEECRLAAIEQCAEVELELGLHRELAGELAALAAGHPLREHLRALLMTALFRSGRQAEALAVYRDTRHTLTSELGVEPGPELQRLHQAVLTGDPMTAGPASPESASESAAVPAQLPADIVQFVGRGVEFRRLDAFLAAEGAMVVTGAAGVGKTALVVHWAHRVRNHFPGGQLFLNLSGCGPNPPARPIDVLTYFLRVLGVAAHDMPLDVEEAAADYRAVLADRRILIILDNARDAEQVRPLLPGGPLCRLLITSRDSLAGLVAREGADRIDLGLLPQADAVQLLRNRIGAARVNAEPASAAVLANRCARLPLALCIASELATSRPWMTLADLTDQLTDERSRLNLLNAGTDRQTAARSVFSWSYKNLPSNEAQLFRLLGLHPTALFSTHAVAALTDIDLDEARHLLASLANVHLIEDAGPDRWRMHDLLHSYAAERTTVEDAEPERVSATSELLTWYLRSADAACAIIAPQRRRVPVDVAEKRALPPAFDTYDQAVQWCDAERTNLIAATHAALDTGRYSVAWRIPIALWDYFYLRKPWTEWIHSHQTGHSAAHRLGDFTGQSTNLIALGVIYGDLRRYEESARYMEEGAAASRAINGRWGEAVSLSGLGVAQRELKQFDNAVDSFHRALTIWRDLTDQWGESLALHNLGDAYRQLRRFDEALQCFHQALHVREQIGDAHGQAWSLHDLASTHHDLKRIREAIHYYQRALEMRRRLHDKHGEARTLRKLGDAFLAVGSIDAARASLRQALVLFEENDDPRAADVRIRLAKIDRFPGTNVH